MNKIKKYITNGILIMSGVAISYGVIGSAAFVLKNSPQRADYTLLSKADSIITANKIKDDNKKNIVNLKNLPDKYFKIIKSDEYQKEQQELKAEQRKTGEALVTNFYTAIGGTLAGMIAGLYKIGEENKNDKENKKESNKN